MKKYEMLEREANGLCRIRALRSFGIVSKGNIGGYIEKESNLSHDGNAWVSDDARVSGNARVFGNAWVSRSKHTEGVWTLTLGKHVITIDGDYLNIGCESYTIPEWLKNYRKIGELAGYSDDEIARYGDAIYMIAKWKSIEGGEEDTTRYRI